MSFEKFSVLAIKVAPLCLALLVQLSCAKRCTRSLEQAPDLRGFRVGTTLSQIQNRFPGFPNLTPNEFGLSKVILNVNPMAEEAVNPYSVGHVLVSASRYPELLGTDRIILEFVDGRLAKIKVFYPKDIKWHSVAEFVQRTSETLNLPDGWNTPNSTEDYRSVYCNGFFVRAGIDNEKYDEEKLPFVEVGDSAASVQAILRSLNKNENENRKEEERRKTFKP